MLLESDNIWPSISQFGHYSEVNESISIYDTFDIRANCDEKLLMYNQSSRWIFIWYRLMFRDPSSRDENTYVLLSSTRPNSR